MRKRETAINRTPIVAFGRDAPRRDFCNYSFNQTKMNYGKISNFAKCSPNG